MKNWKKLASLLLEAVTALGMNAAALAAEADAGTYADAEGSWSEAYVARVTELGLMDGKAAGAFAPNENTSRADLVLALYRLAGEPAVSGENPFADVADNAACRDAVVWANAQGIVAGKSADTFDLDGDVKRQEIAKILNIFAARQVGREALVSRRDVLAGFPDAGDAASWAKEPLNWAAASEFITGAGGGRLDPRGPATRAQTAAILCRYMDEYATGDASKDDPRNQDGIGENELLVVSFGTSYNDNRVETIKAVEDAMEEAFAGYSVRRAFTADTIIEHVSRRDGEVIDNVTEALDRAKANGVKNLLVQPTHLMNGYEYGDLVKALEKRAGDFETVKIGAPLLTSEEDFAKTALAMVNAVKDAVKDDKTAVCYMGHGTAADSNSVYSRMQKVLTDAGHDNYFVGAVESAPTAEDLVKLVKEAGYTKVILRPMMIVAGDHANNDMADANDPESWYSVFTAAGLEVECQISGLGGLEEIQRLLAAHARDAKALAETGIAVQPNPENPDSGEKEPAGPEGGVLADGVYAIEAECQQSMFKIDSCLLTVKDGKMTAALTLGSASFDKMFAGTAAAAGLASDGIADGAEADGKTTFTLPVEALDKALDFAAHSVKKDTWYDRTLTFLSDTAQAQ